MAPAQKHREGLVAAASTLFRRQGYAATGLAEILAESGAPKGSLYHYFPEGKEEIGEAALRLILENNGGRVGALMASEPNPAKMLRRYGVMMAEDMQASGFTAGCPIATIALEAAPRSERLTAACLEVFILWSRGIAHSIRHAGVAAPRATELADFIIASVEGALILTRVRMDTAPLLRATEELARLVETEIQASRSVQ